MPINPTDLVDSYGLWVCQRIAMGFEPTFITIMFKELGGSHRMRKDIMRKDIEYLYTQVLSRVVRHPRKVQEIDLPLWLMMPDDPAFKLDRNHLSDIVINDGRHYHGITLQPPGNRLNEPFSQHLIANESRYRHLTQIERLHAVDLTRTPVKATDYVMKTVKRGRASTDEIIVLPRLHGEMNRGHE